MEKHNKATIFHAPSDSASAGKGGILHSFFVVIQLHVLRFRSYISRNVFLIPRRMMEILLLVLKYSVLILMNNLYIASGYDSMGTIP